MNKDSLRKAIILAGGLGTRLAPLTSVISKQLLPIYNKPMIYYSLSTLMLCGIRDFLIVTTPSSLRLFENLLGDGSKWGVKFTYEIQNKPLGIAQAILIGEEFIGRSLIALALGDNLFHGNELTNILNKAEANKNGATIFAYPVSDPERYGVVEFNDAGIVVNIEEKPSQPRSKYAVTGLYFFDNSAIERVKSLKYSSRGELEITPLNLTYLRDGLLNVELISRGMAWFDTGTFDSLQDASAYIRTLENRQGFKVGCPEEIAWRKGWINDHQLKELANLYRASGYGEYLLHLL